MECIDIISGTLDHGRPHREGIVYELTLQIQGLPNALRIFYKRISIALPEHLLRKDVVVAVKDEKGKVKLAPNSFGDNWHAFVADRIGSPRLKLLLQEARTAKIIPKKLCQSIRKVTRSFENRRCHSLLRNATIAGITWPGASSISQ